MTLASSSLKSPQWLPYTPTHYWRNSHCVRIQHDCHSCFRIEVSIIYFQTKFWAEALILLRDIHIKTSRNCIYANVLKIDTHLQGISFLSLASFYQSRAVEWMQNQRWNRWTFWKYSNHSLWRVWYNGLRIFPLPDAASVLPSFQTSSDCGYWKSTSLALVARDTRGFYILE